MSNLIYKKMSDVMKDIKSISKDQANQVQNYKFRGIDQFVNALYPALTKHGIFMAPSCISEVHEIREVTRSNGKAAIDKHVNLMMSYTFYAEDGSNVVIGPIPAEGLDSGDKATNKALSAALKYALIQTFSIPTEDMAEADLETPEIGSAKAKLTTAKSSNVTEQLLASVPTGISSFTKPKSSGAASNATTASVKVTNTLAVEEVWEN